MPLPAVSVSLVSLTLAYVLSQFYRAFLAVLTPILGPELDASAGDLALSSGLWFIAFAAMQVPIGWALDRFGPRMTVAVLLAAGGGGGAAVFARATGVMDIHLAMLMLGIGCSPVLMGAYYILARNAPAASFGTMAGILVGLGSLGNILSAAPLVWLIDAVGWRQSLWLSSAVTLLIAAVIAATVRDPERLGADHPKGSIIEVLRLRAIWFILPLASVSYAVVGAIRGLWAGPYLSEVYLADEQTIGLATLAMGLAMVMGNFLAGPAARAFRGIRRAMIALSLAVVVILMALIALSGAGLGIAVLLLVLMGLFGAGYPLLMAHGRSLMPQHLVGRGITFLNMFSIGGVGVMQFASRPVYQSASAAYPPASAFAMLFLFFLIPLAIGVALYFLTPEAENG